MIGNPGWRRWLEEEGEHAMRLLTRRETDFQPRLIAAIEELLRAKPRPARSTSRSTCTSSRM